MPRTTLPHGARGIEDENFVLQFLADKIVFVPWSAAEGEHHTFHAGPDSGILDLHETRMSSGRSADRTLFAMRRDDAPAALTTAMAVRVDAPFRRSQPSSSNFCSIMVDPS